MRSVTRGLGRESKVCREIGAVSWEKRGFSKTKPILGSEVSFEGEEEGEGIEEEEK